MARNRRRGSEAERWSNQSLKRLRGEKSVSSHRPHAKRSVSGPVDNDFRMLLGSGTAGRFVVAGVRTPAG